MDLGLRGIRLHAVVVAQTTVLELSEQHSIVIESAFTVDIDGEELDTPLSLRQLEGQTITDATADESGTLLVHFDGSARLTVTGNPDYEAWSVSGPRGALVVSTPGGALAIWKPEP